MFRGRGRGQGGGAADKDEKTGLVVWGDPMQPVLMGNASARSVGIR